MKLSRRSFTKGIVGAAGLTMLGPLGQLQAVFCHFSVYLVWP